MDKKQKNGLLVGGIAALAFVAYEIFSKKTASTPATPAAATTTAAPSSSSILSNGLSFLQNLINPSAKPAPAVVPDQQTAIAPVTTTPATSYSPATTLAPTLQNAPILQVVAPSTDLTTVQPDTTAAAYVPDSSIAGIGTTAETGAIISKVSPALAVIPVVGWIAAGVGSVVGAALQIFGNKWHESQPIRWLTAGYQYYVLGQANVNSDNQINEAQINPAVSWFSQVLGVPVFDTNDWGRLKGLNGQGVFVNNSFQARANNYLTGSNAAAKKIPLDPNAVMEAVQIADGMAITVNGKKAPAGSWGGMVAAPSTIDYSLNNITSAGAASTGLVQAPPLLPAGIAQNTPSAAAAAIPTAANVVTAATSGNTPLYLLVGGAALLLLSGKSKKVSGIGGNLLEIGLLGAAGYIVYTNMQKDNAAAAIPPVPVSSVPPNEFFNGTVKNIQNPFLPSAPFKNFTASVPAAQVSGIGSIGAAPLMTLAALGAFNLDSIDWGKLVVPAAIIGGGYLLYTKVFGGSSGTPSPQTATNNATITANQANVQSTITTTQAAGGVQTMTAAQAAGIANSIWSVGSGSALTADQQDQVVYLVIQANTLLDLLAIIQAFGTKKINSSTFFLNLCNLFGYNCESIDLPGYLNIALSSTEIQKINGYLSAQNINYQF